MSILPGLIYMGLIGGAVINNSIKRNNNFIKIEVKDAAKKIKENYFDHILDVRSLLEYQEGHLDNVFFYESLAKNPKLINQIKKDIKDLSSTILIYCRSGRRASQAAQILLENGYSNIYVVINGGYTELSKNL
tara:strand:+ start:14 stop:412 length:399 start_codon:yes stop_codon:yes gene_type:complete